MLLEKVKATLTKHRMLEGGRTILVAVSGGVDSVVLLAVLHRLASEFSVELAIAHLNHGLRGQAAEEDARFVHQLAESLGVPVSQGRIDVKVVAEERGMNLEAAARDVRRDFLERTAQRLDADRIALGHTRNDRVETLLFHLVRGAGPTGIIGIRPVNPPYIRPLIDVSREEVLSFALEQGLTWREDLTNRDLSFSRNRIRHQIVPLLREMNPRLLEALSRTADLLLDERNALNALLDAPWKHVLVKNGAGRVVLDRQRLRSFPCEVQNLLLRRAAARARGHLRGIEKKHIDALRELANAPHLHTKTHLPALFAHATKTEVRLTTDREDPVPLRRYPIDLGRNELPTLGMAIELTLKEEGSPTAFPSDEDCEVADADRIHFPLHVRSRQEGDRFQPLGMNCEKKLKSFLIDEHIPVDERDRLPLLCDQERIIWVVGKRLSDAVRVTPTTKRLLVMQTEALP
jgi:tRNA(Ile)-lysidine synthase